MRFGILFAIELAVFSWEVATATEQCVASEDSNSCSSQVPSLMQKQRNQIIKTMPSEPLTLEADPRCETWCESDRSSGKNEGRHCAPGDMADVCGGCPFCPAPTPSPPTPSPPPSCDTYTTEFTCPAERCRFEGSTCKSRGIDIKIMTYNIWYENTKYDWVANIIKGKDIDVVSIQEAPRDKAQEVVNALGSPYKLANPTAKNNEHSWQWCGYIIYNSEKFTLTQHWERAVNQGDWGYRGLCGAKLVASGTEYCIFGTHPTSKWGVDGGKDIIAKGADDMKACGLQRSVFMGDMNTGDTDGLVKELDDRTGATWKVAYGFGIDWIFSTYGIAKDGDKICPAHGSCYNSHMHPKWEWGNADHPPVYVTIEMDS